MTQIMNRNYATLRIVAIYALCGLFWIYLSDTILSWFVPDPQTLIRIAITGRPLPVGSLLRPAG